MMDAPAVPKSFVQLNYRRAPRWIPSRYNARAVGDDGRLILWNTLSGAISVFRGADYDDVLALLAPHADVDMSGRLGEYLSRRGFMVRDDVDELERFRFAYARGQWRSDTLELTLLASEECDFRCTYCYEKFQHGTMLPDVREGIRRYVAGRASQLKRLTIAWFGGEPLMGWDAIQELGPFFADVASRHGITHAQTITTNGYLLDDERAGALLSWGCRSFQITLDGLPAEHDCKRKLRDGSATYDVILRNLRSLQQRAEDFRVVIRVNIDRQNGPKLESFVEALGKDFGGDARYMMRFKMVGRWGGDRDADLDVCGRKEGLQFIHELQDAALHAGVRVEAGIDHHSTPGSQVCYAARPYHFVVSATGKLMKCTVALDEMEENIVGQVHASGEWQVSDDRMMRWCNPFFESDATCKQCHLLPTCQGAACPLVRLETGQRSCCSTRSDLKHQLRMTLRHPRTSRSSLKGG
jgi:uncharacterized protein